MNFPCGVEHYPNNFEEPVRNCWEAAISRNIYLEQELKTLVFKVGNIVIIYHGPGHRKMNLAKLKLFGEKFEFISDIELSKCNLSRGTINPFSIDKSGLKYDTVIICKSIFNLKKVYTNDGTLTGTINFSPEVLLHYYTNPIIDEWSVPDSNIFSAPATEKNEFFVNKFNFYPWQISLLKHPQIWWPTHYAEMFSRVYKSVNFTERLICDVGCGTGILGIAAGLKGARVVCTDLNPYAVEMSNINGKLNNVSIASFQGDCLDALPVEFKNKFDYIISNPPTLPGTIGLNRSDAKSWTENGDGRYVLDSLLDNSRYFLKQHGRLIVASSNHQQWNLTLEKLKKKWKYWTIKLVEEIPLSDLYSHYSEDWYKQGLISCVNNNYLDTIRIIEAYNS